MKKIAVLFLMLIVSFQFIDCVVFNLNNDELKKDQILIGKIQGVFTNGLSINNIVFYRGNMKIPFNFDLKNIQDDYYLYANSEGKSSGNYTIKIQGASYLQNGKLTTDDILKNFSISNEIVDFSVIPGLVDSNKDFFITLKNKAENDLKVSMEITSEQKDTREVLLYENGNTLTKEDITLKIGETRILKFVLGEGGKSGFYNLTFISGSTRYDIPVYIMSAPNSYESNRISWQYYSLSFPNLKIKQGNTEVIGLVNLNQEEIKGISFSVSESLKDYVKILNESVNLKKGLNDIYLNVSSNQIGEVQGLISAIINQELTSLSLRLSFIGENEKPKNTSSNQSTTNTNSNLGEVKLSCSSLGGEMCDVGQICGNGGKAETSKDDNELEFCCVDGECITSSTNIKNTNSKLGIILIAILILVLIIIFLKFKSAKRPIDLLKRKKV